MRAQLLTKVLQSAPSGPTEGEIALLCIHKPSPRQGAHFIWVAGIGFAAGAGIGFDRPDGTSDRANWLLLCDPCFKEHGTDIRSAIVNNRVQVGRDIVWRG